MKTILITGAGGYLGSHLIDQLSKEDKYKIFAFDLIKEKLKEKFKHIKSIEFYDTKQWELDVIPFESIDIIIHCAFARIGDGKQLAASLNFSSKIFERANLNEISIVNISSRSVYGQNPETPWTENTPVKPESLYSLAKYASELLATKSKCDSQESYHTNIRLSSLAGFDFDQRIISKFVDNIINNKPIKIVGGKQQFSFLDVRDAVSGIIKLISTDPRFWKKTYNLGSNRVYSIIEIANLVKEISKNYIKFPVELVIEEKEVNLIDEMDSSLFYTEIKWKPAYDMRDIINSIFEYKISRTK